MQFGSAGTQRMRRRGELLSCHRQAEQLPSYLRRSPRTLSFSRSRGDTLLDPTSTEAVDGCEKSCIPANSSGIRPLELFSRTHANDLSVGSAAFTDNPIFWQSIAWCSIRFATESPNHDSIAGMICKSANLGSKIRSMGCVRLLAFAASGALPSALMSTPRTLPLSCYFAGARPYRQPTADICPHRIDFDVRKTSYEGSRVGSNRPN
jgi:hypothetical protein